MLINAAMQLLFMLAELGVMGHCATCRFEPANPPIRVCTSHMPEGEPEPEERFHWIRIAPGFALCVDTIISLLQRRVADGDNRFGGAHGREEGVRAHDDWVGFSYDFGAWWDVNCGGYFVGSRVEKDDFIVRGCVFDRGVERCVVIGLSVAFCAS